MKKSRSLASLGMTTAFPLLLATASCVDSLDPNQFPSGPQTTFHLTDAPFPYDRVSRVDVFVVSVQASWSADTMATSGGNFFTVANVGRKINLLDLQAGLTTELGATAIPQGAIQAIRLIIDTDRSSITMKDGAVLTGSSNPGIAWQSSAGIATLNATIDDRIVVPDSGTDVVIDFDVGRAFLDPADVTPPTTQQGFIFSPVLRALEARRTGSITGTVRQGSATGAPVASATVELKLGNPNNAENTWGVISTTRTDANGNFRFAYVTRSSFFVNQPTWTYNVVATTSTGRAIVRSVTASAGANTAVGTVIVP